MKSRNNYKMFSPPESSTQSTYGASNSYRTSPFLRKFSPYPSHRLYLESRIGKLMTNTIFPLIKDKRIRMRRNRILAKFSNISNCKPIQESFGMHITRCKMSNDHNLTPTKIKQHLYIKINPPKIGRAHV